MSIELSDDGQSIIFRDCIIHIPGTPGDAYIILQPPGEVTETMPPMQQPKDIIDEIDQLVDESLSRPITDDYHSNHYDRCPHCDRQWHGLAVTQRIAGMYAAGTFDDDYRVDTDDSAILCRGSDFIGPMPAENPWTIDTVALASSFVSPWVITPTGPCWWRTTLPSSAEIVQRIDTDGTNSVTIVIGRTEHEFNAENIRLSVVEDVDEVFQSNIVAFVRRRHIVNVLADEAPTIGGPWESLTADARHPDDSAWIQLRRGAWR